MSKQDKTIEVTNFGNSIMITSPFHPEFAPKARSIGGDFINAGNWNFDQRDREAALELLKDTYGYTEAGRNDLVDVRLTLDEEEYLTAQQTGIFLAGRLVARATGRYSGAVLGQGVIMKEGSFGSGGSAKNWLTKSSNGAIFEIRDVYRFAANNIKNMYGWGADLETSVEIIEHSPTVNTIVADASASEEDGSNTTDKLVHDQIQFIDQQINALQAQKDKLKLWIIAPPS